MLSEFLAEYLDSGYKWHKIGLYFGKKHDGRKNIKIWFPIGRLIDCFD